ncbi:MAG: nucleotidyltransferase domain-containing protein [Candidatus Pacebacteria bacterium]|jgi:predicted nucleotidyltransferase|nr:nucleotidyltransferase domain-containing protein [Candidatus Paceibacterota bacterium]
MRTTQKEKLCNEVVSFSDRLLSGRDHFVCIYGSYASGNHTEASDMDMFVAVEDYSVSEFDRFSDFLIGLHVRHGLNLDDEVPYENKLMMSYGDLERAVALAPFRTEKEGYSVPRVEKNKDFLSSPEIRWRLLLNALTSPHECIGGNIERYGVYKDRAEEAVIELARGLSAHPSPEGSHLFEVLIRGKEGQEGEMYLGYKRDREGVMAYLQDLIARYHLK